MLFQSENVLESEKERNFYSKVFAGYYFNELIPGYETRLQAFSELLLDGKQPIFSGPMDKGFCLSPKSTHVTFDFHGYLVDEESDRGELADILIVDLVNKSAVAIEVKFLSDWQFEKDIQVASKRFDGLRLSNQISSFGQVLLVTGTKLKAVQRGVNSPGSNWEKLSRSPPQHPLVILTWEQIAENCTGSEGDTVQDFIHQHIKESRGSLRSRTRKLLNLK